ncbi:MAG: cbb3-type cytochrome c oxidase subunit I [Planctomycetes bacterium]|nr:cbb3-type cytochrome c oxidase subunit I [Planctomycetota bacterium]
MSSEAHVADGSAVHAEHETGENYLNCSHGLRSWLLTLDHKRIAVMYLAGLAGALFLGGIMALVVRLELWTGDGLVLSDDLYNHAFTLHGAIMTFLFIIPGIPAVFGNFALPLMLGAKDVAFPRLNLLSWYLWITGAVFAIVSMVVGAVDTGWTFYTPYSTQTSTQVINMTMGVFILGFSSIFTGLNFVVTIHKLRPAGMTWWRMPLMLWGLYATAIIQVLATPVLGITLLLLVAERALGVGIFDPSLGGDPLLYQHFFWFYSHPAVYIMILPAMGVISELISVHSRKTIFGYHAIALSSVAIAAFSFIVWGHHMFTAMSPMGNMIFSALTFSVSIPSAVKTFNWLATLYRGHIRLNAPMLYALAFIFLFGIGGLTGLFLGALATDIHLHDTYFVVAHFHFVMVGSTLIAFLGALHYWWPKMFGKAYDETLAKIACILVFIGFNVTFLPQFVLGTRGMPRRYHNFLPEFQGLHQASTVGAFILAIGLFLILVYLWKSLVSGKKVTVDNPWGGSSLEWLTTTPPPHYNFVGEPPEHDVYDYHDIRYDAAIDGYVLSKNEGDAAR